MSLVLDCFNLFDTDVAEGVWSTLGTSETFNQPYGFVLPRRAMVGARLKF